MDEPSAGFILNMTSDAKVRAIVQKIKMLSQKTVKPPEMSWFDQEFDPDDGCGPLLPFTAFLITGTAGAGKSTSVNAIHQSLNALVTGATTVAAQNLSKALKCYCPTIYNAFGFKSRHINILPRTPPQIPRKTVEAIQHFELSKYWPIIADISKEFKNKKPRNMYECLGEKAFAILGKMTGPALWTSNIIVIDEAGTLSSYILTAVVYFYWLYNSWLNTPLFREGRLPCIVCVGSPTQTHAFESTYNHSKQKNCITACDTVLSFLISNPVIASYADVSSNWALFINNKRCTDLEFGYLLKVLEYDLEIPEETMSYIDRFIVPSSKILNPLEYVGWTRLFLSHNEVKDYLASLHSALGSASGGDTKLFTCPIVCEVYHKAFEEYKTLVKMQDLSVLEWVSKNFYRMSNYSQFIDQDATAVHSESTESSTRVTYLTKYVKESYISLNGKTKKCIFGYVGTYGRFQKILDSELFIDQQAHDQPEFVYSFLNLLLYNCMFNFYQYGITASNNQYIEELNSLSLPHNLINTFLEKKHTSVHELSLCEDDVFYLCIPPPPSAAAASLPNLITIYSSLKAIFNERLTLAVKHFGEAFLTTLFTTFSVNITVRNGVEYMSTENKIIGLLDYASTVESYKLCGYTYLNTNFGRFGKPPISPELKSKMPCVVVEDSSGFMAVLENNVNKLTEVLENGTSLHICNTSDYGISSQLAMTIVKAQGISLDKVAVCFGKHRNIKKSHVYVAISRATNPNHLILDCNPLKLISNNEETSKPSKPIIDALHNSKTFLVY